MRVRGGFIGGNVSAVCSITTGAQRDDFAHCSAEGWDQNRPKRIPRGLHTDPRRVEECRASRRTLDDCPDLKGHGLPPVPQRPTSWQTFLRAHWGAIAGADFFTTEVWTWRGLVTYALRDRPRVAPHPDRWVHALFRHAIHAPIRSHAHRRGGRTAVGTIAC
jgi:hypothetical protein